MIRRIRVFARAGFPDLKTPSGNSRLLHIIYCSTKVADSAADSIDTNILRLNGKFSSHITLWRSSRLKYLNKKGNISVIKIVREYCYDVKTPCQPAPVTVIGDVPDVACNVVLKISSGMMDEG